jgi:hypothetical protein
MNRPYNFRMPPNLAGDQYGMMVEPITAPAPQYGMMVEPLYRSLAPSSGMQLDPYMQELIKNYLINRQAPIASMPPEQGYSIQAEPLYSPRTVSMNPYMDELIRNYRTSRGPQSTR